MVIYHFTDWISIPSPTLLLLCSRLWFDWLTVFNSGVVGVDKLAFHKLYCQGRFPWNTETQSQRAWKMICTFELHMNFTLVTCIVFFSYVMHDQLTGHMYSNMHIRFMLKRFTQSCINHYHNAKWNYSYLTNTFLITVDQENVKHLNKLLFLYAKYYLFLWFWGEMWRYHVILSVIKHTPIQKSVCDETAIVVVTQDIHTHTQNECVGRFALQPVAITTPSSSLHPAFVNASSHSQGKAHRNIGTFRNGSAALWRTEACLIIHTERPNMFWLEMQQENLQWKEKKKDFIHQE